MHNLAFRQLLFTVFALITVNLFVFLQVNEFEFQNYDDPEYINHPVIQNGVSFNNLYSIFTASVNSNWHPVTVFSFALEYQIVGKNASSFHLTNLTLHILTTLIVFFSMRMLIRNFWGSFFIALLFSVLPLNVESVAWVAERKGLLAGLAFFLSFYFYLRYRTVDSKKYYYFSIIVFILGLLSKASIVFTPVLLLLTEIFYLNRSEYVNSNTLKLTLIKLIPYFILAFLFSLITIYIHNKTGALEADKLLGVADKITNAIHSYGIYLWQFFAPFNLSVFYSYKFDHNPVLTSVILFGLLAVTVFFYKLRKTQPYLLFGWLWFIFAMAPTSGIIQTGIHAHADRYMYVPSIGLLFLIVNSIATITAKFKNSHSLFLTFMFGFSLIFSIISYFQTQDWESPQTLFSKVLKRDKTSQVANWGLSAYYINKNNISAGMKYYEKVREVKVGIFSLYQGIARLLLKNNYYKEAERVLKDGIQVYPNADVHYRLLGRLYAVQKRFNEATPLILKAIELNPYYPANLRVLTERYYFAGDYVTAKKYCDVLTSKYNNYQYGIDLCNKIENTFSAKDR